MAQLHQIRRRLKSIGKIEQITSAMERVAASKMRRAQAAAACSRPYAASAREILAQLVLLTDPQAHPLFARREVTQRLIIMFSSDRGLAGAYNSNLARLLLRELPGKAGRASTPRLIVIGRKGALLAAKLEQHGDAQVIGAYTDWPAEPSSTTLQPIVDTAIGEFTTQRVDAVDILFTDFVSSLRQQATLRRLLPIDPSTVWPAAAERSRALTEALFEPSPAAVLTYIVPRLLGVQLYQASLEAAASEHSMRMLAMKNASDNADGILDDLRLTYNSARQAAITQELAEISGGVEAMK